MTGKSPLFRVMTLLAILLAAGGAHAAGEPPESAKLQSCLRRADALPDMAAAEAALWIRKGGGNDAHLCHAFAQGNRGLHTEAAREFWNLAAGADRHDVKRAAGLHALAGHEFRLANDRADAEAQYIAALKEDPRNPGLWVAHAKLRMDAEKYWDAVGELTFALRENPRDAEALRLRGLCWLRLENPRNAQEDFAAADALGDKTSSK